MKRNIQTQVYAVDTSGMWAEAHNVQEEPQRAGFAQPAKEVCCHLKILNVRVHKRQRQTLHRATALKDKRSKLEI